MPYKGAYIYIYIYNTWGGKDGTGFEIYGL